VNGNYRHRGFTPHVALTALLAAAALALAIGSPVAASAQAHGAQRAEIAKKKQSAEERRRARIRRDLARQLRRNPTLIYKRSFVKKASLVDFRLPLTVRLTDGSGSLDPTDAALEIQWDDSVIPWPAFGVPAATQTTSLKGSFSLEASWGDDASGYGEPGTMETVQGRALSMTATPFSIADFNPFCVDGPQLQTAPGPPVLISSAGFRYGLLNPFTQRFRGSLSLRMTFAAGDTSTCGGAPVITQTVDNSSAPAMPIRFDGTFRTSPAITADGHVRFGEITIDDSVTPQLSTFAYVRTCTGTLTCAPEQFPARLKLKKLTAEVLLGDVGP
jgi:hypothetical protein